MALMHELMHEVLSELDWKRSKEEEADGSDEK